LYFKLLSPESTDLLCSVSELPPLRIGDPWYSELEILPSISIVKN
jgi:hypothetical protein